jgi:hypothetical protein
MPGSIDDETLQIEPEFARKLIAHLPEGLQRISNLSEVNYEWQHNIATPKFDDSGKFSGATLPSIEEFNKGDYHKTRVLTGYTSPDGTAIKAIRLYQAHVLIHEFFHTVEVVLRSEETAKKLQLSEGRTFADWAQDFLESLKTETQHTSNYAGVYHEDIYDEKEKIRSSVTPHDYAVREQMAEAFVAYLLDIISNPDGYTSFETETFGNPKPAEELSKHGGQSKRYGLMKELCNSKPEMNTDTNS